jgi:hypothetical protein
MKKSLFCLLVLAALWMFVSPQKAQAQYVFGYSEVGYNQNSRYVYGYSSTTLDYYAGLYYDPEVAGYLFWQFENEIPLDEGYGYGFEDIFPAEVFNYSTAYRSSTVYDEQGNHYITPYYSNYYYYNYWYDPYGFSFFTGGTYGGYHPWYSYFFDPYYYSYGQRNYVGTTDPHIKTPDDDRCPVPGQYFDAATDTCGPPPDPIDTVRVSYKTETANNGIPLANGTAPGDLPNRNSTEITATGSPTGGTFSWSTSSDRVTLSSSSGSATTVTARRKSDSVGDVVIDLAYTHNGRTVRVQIPMTVQQPTALKYLKTVKNEPIPAGRTSRRGRSQSGWRKDIDWQVVDQFGRDMTFRMPLGDTINNDVPNSCFTPKMGEGTLLSEGKGTGGNGQWTHRYTLRSTACTNGGNCASPGYQRYTVNGFVLSDDDKSYTYQCNGIHLEGDGSAPTPVTPPARKKTAAFVDYFYMGSIEDLPSDAELQSWTDRLNAASAQGQSQMLAEAKALGRALFQSADYASRNRSDEDFVADLFYGYLQRAPDSGGYNAWLNVVRDYNAQGLNGREVTLQGFENSTEFANLVYSLEAAPPPDLCDTTEQQNCYSFGGHWNTDTCSCEYYEPPPDPCYSYGYAYNCY